LKYFLWQMESKITLQTQTIVADMFRNWPETVSVFTSRKTKCVGCLLHKFCTLGDVAEMYRFPLQELIDELENFILKTYTLKGDTHE